jgi:GH24 family phage-related lysozyme (muramidase)
MTNNNICINIESSNDNNLFPIVNLTTFGLYCCSCRADSALSIQTPQGLVCVSQRLMNAIKIWEGCPSHPYVPGGQSGVTIGYGYDLGQQTPTSVQEKLTPYFTTAQISLFLQVVGLQGLAAHNALPIVSSISIPHTFADQAFLEHMHEFALITAHAYPRMVYLHPDCQGALLSLVFNRGIAFSVNNKGQQGHPDFVADVHREQRNIRDLLANGHVDLISNEFSSMKRIWLYDPLHKFTGLRARRDEEATYFKNGIDKHLVHLSGVQHPSTS